MYFIARLSAVAALMTVASASTNSTSPTATTLNTSTCSRQSIAACPTPYDPCCAFVCAEAQVPFDVCSPNNETFLASCYACDPPTATPTITTPPSSTITTSTCSTGYSATGCPATPNPCCAWICEEAQVPFALCSASNGSGEFESCSQCPTAAARL